MILNLHQQKEELRQRLLEQRKSIPEDIYQKASSQIIQKLKQQKEFKSADIIHCYVSINTRREVDTKGLIKEMLSSGKKVVVPVTNFQEGTLTHIRLDSYDNLVSNKWGVQEPEDGKEIMPEELELVIVPMVAGDERCNRIGYGEGFYDRFLKQVNCPKIGLIFERNVLEQVPVEDFDIPLDKILTEDRIINRH